MNTKVKCRECGEMISRKEAIEYEKEFVCQDCFDEEYTVCSDCGCIVPISETTVINPDRRSEKKVCYNCSQKYSVCDICGEHLTDDEVWASDDERSICYNCNTNYCTCEDCGTILHYNDARYSSYDENYYCEDCYQDHNSSYIEEYSYKPDPIFLGYRDEWQEDFNLIDKNMQVCYVKNLSDDLCSEFGYIGFRKQIGGLVRVS